MKYRDIEITRWKEKGYFGYSFIWKNGKTWSIGGEQPEEERFMIPLVKETIDKLYIERQAMDLTAV